MRGLELAEQYWLEVGEPVFRAAYPQILECCAVGLVGEGSECFGYDDEISRDHDWGPGFCLWLNAADMAKYGQMAQDIYSFLPQEFLGFQRLRTNSLSAGRVGVLEIGAFYYRFLGLEHLPQSLDDWRRLPEEGLATATNGKIFCDATGEFTRRRQHYLTYYPEDVRRKKLACRCALAAQAGQYNYSRCRKRGDAVTGLIAVAKFIQHAQAIVFLLNRRYRPYYKWTQRELGELPVLGASVGKLLEELADGQKAKSLQTEMLIEEICAMIIQELANQKITDSSSDFLLDHAWCVQERIADEKLRQVHLMSE